jgi:hypothetical protein
MRHRTSLLALSLGILLAPPTGAGALTDAQQRCQSQVAKDGQSFIRKSSRALRRCQDRISAGGLDPSTDCTVEPRAAAGIQLATQRLTDGITRRCPDALVATLIFGGSCYGVATAADLVACQVAEHRAQVVALVDTIYATPPEVTGVRKRCEAGVAREGALFASRRHRILRRCKDRIARGSVSPTTDCTASLALARAASASAQAILDRCSDPVVPALTFGKPCTGASTAAGLAACALGTHRDRVDRAVVVEYGGSPTGGASVARQIADTADCVGGPLSRCRAGDYLLANDRIRVVVQDLQRNLFGIGAFGGQIIDADLVRTVGPDRDNFEEMSAAINLENTAHYTSLVVLNDGSDGQAAIIRVTGVDDLLDLINPSSVLAGFGQPFPASANDVDLPIEVMTDYVLEPGTNYVRIETTLQNLAAMQLKIFFGDFVNGSGQAALWQPGYGFGEPLITTRCALASPNPCDFFAYEGYNDGAGVSYGYVDSTAHRLSTFTTVGVSVPLIGTEVILAVIGVAQPNHVLEPLGMPGDQKTIVRHFVVGDGTVQSIIDARSEIQLLATGDVVGTVTVGGVPVAGADVVLIGTVTDGPVFVNTPRNVVAHTTTDAAGQYRLSAAPGSYTLEANLEGAPYEGGGATPVAHPVTLAAYTSATQNIAFPATGAIQVSVTNEAGAPFAAKASVVGFDPSSDPLNTQQILNLVTNRTGIFNDRQEDGIPFGLSQVHFIDPSGTTPVVPIEPGSYRVVLSHGPEYSVAASDIAVVAGATTPVSGQIARVLDTTGFVGSDFHVHSIDSADAQVSRADRVRTMLAEGVDFFTPSDHEFRADFAPTIAALGASSLVGTATSNEITTFDYGHFNAWPMTIDPSQVNGGAVDHGGAAPAGLDFPSAGNYSLTPAQIIAAAAADPGTNTVQVNHIHSHFGMEGGSGLAIDTGVTPPQSLVPAAARRLPALPNFFTDTFNALEIWIGDDRGQINNLFLGQNIGDWFNLLNQGIVRTAVADSDTHSRIGTQAGIPRSMVASPNDAPGALSAIADTLSANVNAGRLVGTNAPMVRVTANAASTGETAGLALGLPRTIATTDGSVDVTVQIQSPLWAEFDRVEYYVNSTTTKTIVTKNSGAGNVMVRRYSITPDFVQTAPADFTVAPVVVDPMVPGASRLEATTTLALTGLTEDIWVVVLVKGTDGVSRPLFPVEPNSLKTSTNTTLANLTDGNLGEDGLTALAFTNPLFVDVDGGGWTAPGVQVSNPGASPRRSWCSPRSPPRRARCRRWTRRGCRRSRRARLSWSAAA